MELNPNNPILQTAHDHWHKFVAILMLRYGITDYEITDDDILRLSSSDCAVVLDGRSDRGRPRLVLRLIPNAEAERLARLAGGLPT